MLVLAAALAAVIGVTLGLLGGGGSILTLPMLLYVLELEPRAAIASSLFVVGVTSLVGVVAHARAGRVRFRTGLPFGVAGMAGAFAGGQLAHHVPPTALLLGFAAMMILTAAAMLRGRGGPSAAPPRASLGKALGLGASVGLVSGLVGAGGGFLVVPALALFGGLAMPEAVGTSLLVIALQSLAGVAGHVTHVALDWPLLAALAGAAVVGSLVGTRLARHASPDVLRQAFGWLVLAMGAFVLTAQGGSSPPITPEPPSLRRPPPAGHASERPLCTTLPPCPRCLAARSSASRPPSSC
ncbi:MAG: sulfite exporter TauE/SafE family protein [Polyangiaceae bacterium]|nr:sulfite exporter TauE/SafE family protein [Polyangiaceae bacterium]